MTAPRMLLILTENWTMRPVPGLDTLVEFAVEAERAGIDAVMVSEHIVLGPSADADGLPANPRDYALPGNQDPATSWPSPLILLSAIAAATSRIRLVAGAIISPLRHPLALAKDLATLDQLSHGRLVVLPTVSWHRDEYDALGVPFAKRGEILDEQLEIWAKAWRGSPISHEGRHFTFGDVWVEPQPFPAGGPALWFGGSTLHPRLISRLVRYGSGFNPLGRPDDEGLDRLAKALASAAVTLPTWSTWAAPEACSPARTGSPTWTRRWPRSRTRWRAASARSASSHRSSSTRRPAWASSAMR